MAKIKDITGEKFGKLIAIKSIYPNDKFGNIRWLCKCECGKEIITKGCALRSGNTKSCGCLSTTFSNYFFTTFTFA